MVIGCFMVNRCACGSFAINQHCHGRSAAVDLHLCDVCYWRSRAALLADIAMEIKAQGKASSDGRKAIVDDELICQLEVALDPSRQCQP